LLQFGIKKQFPGVNKEYIYQVVNVDVYVMATVQVQVRLPEELARQIDKWIQEGKFLNRSDAIKAIVSFYNERDRTRKFYDLLERRRREAKEKPARLIPLEKIR
jgi:Arc/MetJ-type ribon-helix-helix transcriptional regulator